MDDTPDEASCSISKVGRIVLNAELKSINKALAYEFGFSRCSITLWVNMIVASSVHLFFLYAYCASSNDCSVSDYRCFRIILSRHLNGTEVSATGR